jgi:tetratricopeptide (TPR) repeat protein
MKKWAFVFFIILYNISNLFSQSSIVDSLKLALKSTKHDTTRCNILVELSDICSEEDLPKFNEQLKTIAENNLKLLTPKQPQYNLFKKHLASAFNNIGLEFNSKGDFTKAMENWGKSLELQKEIGDKRGMIISLNNFGFTYKSQGNISKALEYHSKSLKLSEEIGDKAEIANTLSFIAIIYRAQGDINKALDYYTKSLKLQEEIGDRIGIAYSLNNIGYVYQQMGDPTVTSSKEDAERAGHFKALDYYLKSVNKAMPML